MRLVNNLTLPEVDTIQPMQYHNTKCVEIIPQVYQIAHRGTNIILIAGEELTLIDTGFRGSSLRIINFIHNLGRSVADSGLQVIHTPGHTPGSISLFFIQKKLVIVGDALNNRQNHLRFPPKFVSSDLTQTIESVKQIAQLDFDILCFGHGKPLTKDALTEVHDLIKKHEL